MNERIELWRRRFLDSDPVGFGLFMIRMKYEDLVTYLRNQKKPNPDEVEFRLGALNDYVPHAVERFGIPNDRLCAEIVKRGWNVEYFANYIN